VAGVATLTPTLLSAAPAQAAKATNPGKGEVVRTWNDVAFTTVRDTKAIDAVAARTYAMVNVAMFDAVNALSDDPRSPAIVAPDGSASGDPAAAAATAAHDVLVALRPDRAALSDAQLAKDLAAVDSRGPRRAGSEWGAKVAAAVVAARADDGSSGNETQAAGTGVGEFRSSWSNVQFRNLAPFAVVDSAVYLGPPPPALTSNEYAVAFDDVKSAGNAAIDDAAALGTFRYWSLGSGTDQPPGAWLQVASNVSRSRDLALQDTARLFALESMAMADTVGPTFATKARYHTWRPVTAIREADSDGNDVTVADPTWTARGGNAGSPEYWSGHSTFSAAGAEVLARFFCTDDVPFTLVTDSGAGASRTYPSFSAAAAEAGRSRVLGGLHFEFSNQTGLSTGRAIAAEVVATSLLRTSGADRADCPA
jgi:hypothetical protein